MQPQFMVKTGPAAKLSVGLAAAIFLAGCTSFHDQISQDASKNLVSRDSTSQVPVQIGTPSRVTEIRGASMPVSHMANARGGEWLKAIPVEVNLRQAVSLASVVDSLSAQGVNISTDLKLSSYSFGGRISRTDADTALKIILGSAGLDFHVDDIRKVVVIKPMASKTWYLSIGNRKSTFNAEASNTNQLGSNSNSNSNSSSQSAQRPSFPSMGGGGSQGNGSGSNSNSNTPGVAMSSQDDFWASLSKELENRLTILIPKAGTAAQGGAQSAGGGFVIPPLPGQPMVPSAAPAIPTAAVPVNGPTQGGSDAEGNLKRQIGSYSVNPETGAITVQAPGWILDDLNTYMKRIQEMYNTDITFTGELILVTSSRADSEGVDLTAFAQWAGGKYGAVISNNALGGVTVSVPGAGALPSVAAGAQTVGGALTGLTFNGSRNALQIFNAFLSENGRVSVIQRPQITTTSGVPGIFSKKYTDFYNTVSQEAVGGSTGAPVTATRNTIVPVEFGTELRINPRIDVATGLIRAQLTLNQAIQSGSKQIPQTITAGGSSVTIPTTIPIVTQQNLSGEILLRDGDLVVVGGQSEDVGNTSATGLPGESGPIGAGIFGVKKASNSKQTYYFALRVIVNKRK